MDYEGIYYCTKCGLGVHLIRIMKHEKCECGNRGFMSMIDFDITEVIDKAKEILEGE